MTVQTRQSWQNRLTLMAEISQALTYAFAFLILLHFVMIWLLENRV